MEKQDNVIQTTEETNSANKPGSEERKNILSRRDFLRTAGIVGTGLVAAACTPATPPPQPTAVPQPTSAPPPTAASATAVPPTVSAAKSGLAPGMIGGPTGFPGAERYQYAADSPAGRAILGLKSLPADKKPQKLIVMLADGAVGHFGVPYPTGAPPVKDVFKEETGIELEIVGVSPDDQLTKIVQDYTTKAAQYDMYSFWNPDKGALYETGATIALDDFVAKYQPEWQKNYNGGPNQVLQFNGHAGKIVAVDFDGDYQIWQYRLDLFEDAEERKNFKAKYGWDLQWPETYDQLAQIAEFFHRPDKNLWGMTDLRNKYWGFSNWYQTYSSMASPNQFYFDPATGKPLINSPEGIKATKWHVDTLKWHSPDGVSWGWPEQYANFTAAGAATSCMYPNAPKFIDNPDNKDSKVVGKMRSGVTPGHVIGGKLVRRTVWWPNITLAISSQSKYPEASYLALQWLDSPSIFTWMTGNPAGYFDPFQNSDFEDPNVIASYKPWHIPIYKASIERSVPPITLNGANEYVNALDENLQAALAGSKTSEQAMEDTAKEWEKITDRLGRDKQIVAMKALADSYPTKLDEVTIKA